jgi:GNAT superfamily N-acetyltransferase
MGAHSRMTSMQISTLRQRPGFATAIAARCWAEWWSDSDTSLADYRRGIEACALSEVLPGCFVAHAGDDYVGSILLIANDLDSRPNLTPWLAALWVEPNHRRQGVAARLMAAACVHTARLRYPMAYLCATPEKTRYYLNRGFHVIETDVEGMNVFAISCARPTKSAQ